MVARKKTPAVKKVETEEITLEQALKEEGEGRTPQTLDKIPSKMNIARNIYKEEYEKNNNSHPPRKILIERFMKEANLTKAGSSTYVGNLKKELSRD